MGLLFKAGKYRGTQGRGNCVGDTDSMDDGVWLGHACKEYDDKWGRVVSVTMEEKAGRRAAGCGPLALLGREMEQGEWTAQEREKRDSAERKSGPAEKESGMQELYQQADLG